MKYRHYAPQASMRLICGGGDDFYARATEFLCERLAESEDIGVLCPDEIAERLTGKYIVRLGRSADTEEHARRLFSALYVRTPDSDQMGKEDRRRLQQHIRMAEQAGADISTIYGDDIPQQIAEFARIYFISSSKNVKC